MSNRRHAFFAKLREANVIDADPDALLQSLWFDELRNPKSQWSKFFVESRSRRGVNESKLDYRQFEFAAVSTTSRVAQCGTCKQISWTNVANVCTRHNCKGTLSDILPVNARKAGYRNQYQYSAPNGMMVEEHTGQLSNEYAEDVQHKFTEGQINVLSCSTTFELGVDLGEIQAVLMKKCSAISRKLCSTCRTRGKAPQFGGTRSDFCTTKKSRPLLLQ